MNKQILNRPIAVTDASFDQEVLQSDLPVLVDFWAEWCGPCRTLGPTIDSLAADYEGRAKVVKLNVDENPETATGLGIRSIPTLMVFEAGVLRKTTTGVKPAAQLAQLIDPYVA